MIKDLFFCQKCTALQYAACRYCRGNLSLSRSTPAECPHFYMVSTRLLKPKKIRILPAGYFCLFVLELVTSQMIGAGGVFILPSGEHYRDRET